MEKSFERSNSHCASRHACTRGSPACQRRMNSGQYLNLKWGRALLQWIWHEIGGCEYNPDSRSVCCNQCRRIDARKINRVMPIRGQNSKNSAPTVYLNLRKPVFPHLVKRFFDLAMKVIAGQASDAERAELDALLAMLESGGYSRFDHGRDYVTQTNLANNGGSFFFQRRRTACVGNKPGGRAKATHRQNHLRCDRRGSSRVGTVEEEAAGQDFLVERDLATTLKLVKDYIAEQTRR